MCQTISPHESISQGVYVEKLGETAGGFSEPQSVSPACLSGHPAEFMLDFCILH